MPADARCADAAPGSAWTLTGPDGLQIRVLALGAAWVGCRVPLAGGAPREVLLGFDDLASQQAQQAYVGATVGRWANRIAGRTLRRGSQAWPLACGPGANHQLHGGPGGFHQRTWQLVDATADRLHLALQSPDGDQGFPGALAAEVVYSLQPGLALQIDLVATLQGRQPCPVGLTSHAYFQLDGARPDAGHDVRRQRLQLQAGRVLPVDADGLPTAAPQPVPAALDWRAPRPIGQALDHAFLLDAPGAVPAATLHSADGRLALDLATTAPALQVYTGGFLAPCTQGCRPAWPDFSGIALEPQFLPDSPHHPEWPQPDCWLAPGARWQQRSVYRFRPG